jgi:large subunit ribosomal protein L18
MRKKIPIIKFQRKRKGKTNYKKRLALLESRKTRMVVRKSLKNIVAQLVQYSPEGDKVMVTAHSRELIKLGWKFQRSSTPAAYLTGLLLAKKAKEHKVSDAIVDLGLQNAKSSVVYAAVKGAIDGGLKIPVGKEVIPSDERIEGKHIAYKDAPKTQFTAYAKANLDPASIPQTFQDVKAKLQEA